jgi:hypothetical protein
VHASKLEVLSSNPSTTTKTHTHTPQKKCQNKFGNAFIREGYSLNMRGKVKLYVNVLKLSIKHNFGTGGMAEVVGHRPSQ